MKHYNWQTISEMARKCPQFALGILALDLDDPLSEIIMKGIGYLFLTDKPTQGPIPWSFICNWRDSNGDRDRVEACAHFGIPTFIFQYPDRGIEPNSGVLPMPAGLEYPRGEGESFTWNNEEYIVLLADAGFALDFVPAKCVDMSC